MSHTHPPWSHAFLSVHSIPSQVSYRQPRSPKDTGILWEWQTRTSAFDSEGNYNGCGKAGVGTNTTWPRMPALAGHTSPIWKQGRKKPDCGPWKFWPRVSI